MQPRHRANLAAWRADGFTVTGPDGQQRLQAGRVLVYTDLDTGQVKALILNLLAKGATQILVEYAGKRDLITPGESNTSYEKVPAPAGHKLGWYLDIIRKDKNYAKANDA